MISFLKKNTLSIAIWLLIFPMVALSSDEFIVKIPNEGDVNFKEEDKVKLSWLAKDIRALDLVNTKN